MDQVPSCAMYSLGFVPVIAGFYLAYIFWNLPVGGRLSRRSVNSASLLQVSKLVIINAFFLALIFLAFYVSVTCSAAIMR